MMAEEKKATEPKSSDKVSASDRTEMLVSVLSGLFGHRIGDALIASLLGFVAKKAERVGERPKHLVNFGEALTKLHAVDQRAYDVIRDFMAVELTADADRNDFQVRTAKMGGDDPDVTVAFLLLVAAEPDHQSRKEFLDEMGVIGERAIDPLERVQLWGNRLVKNMKSVAWKEHWENLNTKLRTESAALDEATATINQGTEEILRARGDRKPRTWKSAILGPFARRK